jgi:hypothetical protein
MSNESSLTQKKERNYNRKKNKKKIPFAILKNRELIADIKHFS